MNTCIFCGRRANSREHVIAKRLARRLQIDDERVTVAALTESEGFRSRGKCPVMNYQCRAVCRDCNHGWMNELEAWLDGSFGDLFEPTWPPTRPDSVRGLTGEVGHLLRWLVKTAGLAEASGILGKLVVPKRLLSELWEKSDWPDFNVLLGFIRDRNLDCRLEKGFRTWNGGALHMNQEHRDGFSFAVQLNHLALRLIVCPGAEVVFTKVPTCEGHAIPFFVTKGEAAYASAPRHTYPDMNSFYCCAEVMA